MLSAPCLCVPPLHIIICAELCAASRFDVICTVRSHVCGMCACVCVCTSKTRACGEHFEFNLHTYYTTMSNTCAREHHDADRFVIASVPPINYIAIRWAAAALYVCVCVVVCVRKSAKACAYVRQHTGIGFWVLQLHIFTIPPDLLRNISIWLWFDGCGELKDFEINSVALSHTLQKRARISHTYKHTHVCIYGVRYA